MAVTAWSIFAWSLLFMVGNTTAADNTTANSTDNTTAAPQSRSVVTDAATAAAPTPKTKTQIVVTFAIGNITIDELSEANQTLLKSYFQDEVANATVVPKVKVAVSMRMGRQKNCFYGLIVQSDIDVADDTEGALVMAEMGKAEKQEMIKAAVKASPILKYAIEAKTMTVDHLGSCTPKTDATSVVVAETVTVTIDPVATTVKATKGGVAVATTTTKAAVATDFAAPFAAAPVLAMVASTIALCV